MDAGSEDPLDDLSMRELHILGLMAAGYSNAGICAHLHLSAKTIETHVGAIYRKLDLPASPHTHRRVMAVLIYRSSSRRFRPAA